MRLVLTIAALASLVAVAQPANDQFHRLDANQDGVVTREELPERIRGNFARVDTDGDGKISLTEHQAFRAQRPGGAQPTALPARFAETIEAKRDLPYADDENPRHRLDLYLPKQAADDALLPVVVFIHGGGWRGGDKTGGGRQVLPFVAAGHYAGVSVGYRLSGEAQWPAQLDDCKAAIRWLKAHAAEYHLDSDRIAVWGSSAGGHLVNMLGLTNDRPKLEGKVGKHLDQNSNVTCVMDWYGPANLLTMNTPRGALDHDAANSPESLLIGGAVQENPERARAASPITYVTAKAPPFLIVHGTDDHTVPFQQSEELVAALTKAEVKTAPVLLRIEGAGHGVGIAGPQVSACITAFLNLHLRSIPAEIESATLPATQQPAKRYGEPIGQGT